LIKVELLISVAYIYKLLSCIKDESEKQEAKL